MASTSSSSDEEFFDAASDTADRSSLIDRSSQSISNVVIDSVTIATASTTTTTTISSIIAPLRTESEDIADSVSSSKSTKPSSPSDPDAPALESTGGDSDQSSGDRLSHLTTKKLLIETSSVVPTIEPLQEEDDAVFVQPKPPPRRKKRSQTGSEPPPTPTTTSTTIITTTTAAAIDGATNLSERRELGSELGDRQSRLRESMRTNFSSLIDDIASIQGDLSVTDAFVAHGDRKSVYADDLRRKEQLLSDELIEKVVQENLNRLKRNASTSGSPAEKNSVANSDEIGNSTTLTVATSETAIITTTGDTTAVEDEELRLVSNCLNPISLHLMKLNHEFDSELEELDMEEQTDGKDLKIAKSQEPIDQDVTATNEQETEVASSSKKQLLKNRVRNLRKLGADLRRRFGRHEQQSTTEHSPSGSSTPAVSGLLADAEHQAQIKFKSNRKKEAADFSGLRLIQELNDCRGAIWCMRWSTCGRLLAVAGQDQLLRVYCSYNAWKHFTQLRSNASGGGATTNTTGSGSLERSSSLEPSRDASERESECMLSEEGPLLLFSAYRGHTADVLDIAWSKNHFLLSSSMDKTVLLWHVSRVECLCIFRHIDFVTTIQFHPRDDRYFLSGSLDGKVRLWNIPDKRVTLWNEVTALPSPGGRSGAGHLHTGSSSAGQSGQPAGQGGAGGGSGSLAPSHGLITASAFVQNGKFAVIGTYDGRVIFYTTDQLKYFTQLHVSAQKQLTGRFDLHGSSADRRKRKHNYKITGIEGVDETKILVTTNDSRIRLYDLRDLSLACKYKGHTNVSSQIKASISHDNRYIVCGSENSSFYIWRLQQDTAAIAQRRDRNSQWESVRLLPSTATTPYGGALGLAPPAGSTSVTSVLPSTQPNNSLANVPSATVAGSSTTVSAGFSTNTMAMNSSTAASTSSTNRTPGIVTCATFATAPSLLDSNAKYVIAVADFSGTIKLFAK